MKSISGIIAVVIIFASTFTFGKEASASDVYWNEFSPNMVSLDYGMAIDWGFSYTVEVTESRPIPLILLTCESRANEDRFCYSTVLQLPAKSGSNMIRYGVDASQYDIGTNVYTQTLILGGREPIADTLTIIVEVQ